MDEEEKEENNQGFTKKHYETLARWAKDIGLGASGVLVAPQLINGLSLSSPVTLFGTFLTLLMFSLAIYWLKKS